MEHMDWSVPSQQYQLFLKQKRDSYAKSSLASVRGCTVSEWLMQLDQPTCPESLPQDMVRSVRIVPAN